MKPWLLNILACPIDKHHPLEAHIFEWSTSKEEIEKISEEAGTINKKFRKSYKQLTNQIIDKTISFPSLKVITDYTRSVNAKALLNRVINAGNKVKDKKALGRVELLKGYLEEIDVLYRFLNLVEIKEGLLFCEKCERWYPIGRAVEGIPELLPDDLRDKEEELEWLIEWEKKIPLNLSVKH